MEPVIGIDLGTTNSVVATVEDGVPTVISGRSGYALMPSVVAISRTGKRLVGSLAKRQAMTNPTWTVHAAKRVIGRKWAAPQTQEARRRVAYTMVEGPHEDVRVELGDDVVSVPEIAAMILTELRLDAEAYLGEPVTKAVVTVPAHFNDNQRQSTRDAGRIAGLDVLRIINEPTAAALAYGFGREVERRVLVFDLGGGTFDVSLLDIANGVFDVVATGGDTFLGGEDFDERIIEALVASFKDEHGVNLRDDKMALQRLRDAAEKAKIDLSSLQQAEVSLPFIHTGPAGALHLQRSITRDEFETLARDLVERCLTTCLRVVEDAQTTPSRIDDIIFVGGMSRMPLVQAEVRKLFNREPARNVHPDEVVALGAAIQAKALARDAGEMLLLDVTPQSLGIMIAGGLFQVLIPRNTTVPANAQHLFTTSRDGQTTAKIVVVQGEEADAAENELLGEFILTGLRSAPRGEVSIEVLFDISADGIVSVSARDVETGQHQSITVTAASGLTEDEVREMMESNAEYLVAQQTAARYDEVRGRVEALLKDQSSLVDRVGPDMTNGDAGAEVLERAKRIRSHAQSAIDSRDVAALLAAQESLEQSVALFQGIAARGR